MKKTKLKKKSKSRISLLKRKLWEFCKTIIRVRDGNICVICGKKNLEKGGWHTGHFLPSSTCGAFLRYDLRNLHSSCYNCNINLGGNGALYYLALIDKFGKAFVDSIIKDRQKSIKADETFYNNKIKEYEEISSWSKDKLLNHTKIYTGQSPL